MKLYLFVLSLFFCSISFAQSSISGTVVDASNQPIPGASIKIVGDAIGTVTDFDGKFTLTTQKNPPYSIEISSIGFSTQKVEISTNNQVVNVKLTEEETRLNEIVVSASRTPERILESPVTVERMGIADVKNTTAVSFYEGLENLKEVQVNTSSLSFKSVNTRGFATIANTRFMQLVDGMDNSSPALNFVLGNLIGLNDLDVQSVELLPGASSALYGANAFNGILFMNSKSPFDYQGISTYVKGGVTSQEIAGTNNYIDVGFRAAHKFSDVFAAKWNINFLDATEWIAGDTRNLTGGVNDRSNPNYDGLNVYGDEVTTFIPNVGQVSRTGYLEQDLNDNTIESVKSDISLHFKPWKNDLEFIAQYKVGLGNTIYQGANRYRLENFLMQQIRAEIRNRNFFVRAYMTTEDAGDSYDMRFAAWNINRAAKSDTGWFTDYASAFLQSQIFLGFNADQAAAAARDFATNNTPITGLNLVPNGQAQFQPGTPQFAQALETVKANPDLTQGAKFIDNSRIYHSDVNYNFKEVIKFAEFQIGGSYRIYELNSQGTIFTDFDGPIDYSEYGIYGQVQKKFLAEDRLKLTASVRYDKSELFDGQYSPRVSFVYSAGERKNHNFRASYQTGFRNPTTQDLYIGLDLGPFALIGSAADNLDRYQETLPVSLQGQTLPGVGATVNLSGQSAYNNAYTIPSVQAFAASGNPDDLVVANIGLVKPEQVQAFELGYKSVLENGLAVDLNGYYNIYNDFMSTSRVITPYYGTVGNDPTNPSNLLSYAALANGDRRVYQVYSNSTSEITSLGFGVGLSKKVYQNYELGVNYNYADFDFDQAKDPTFIAGFNTPKHRVKGSFGSASIFKNFGAFVNVRWTDTYLWQSSFADGTIPAVTVFDAQASYAIPSLKSVIKLSASNLLGDDYLQVIGAGLIGQTYLLSLTINP